MVVFAFQVLSEIFDDFLAQVLLTTPLLASVHLEVVKIAIVAVRL